MNRGYVKFWRKMADSFFYKDSQAVHLWIHLLLLSNHKDNQFMWNNKRMICKRGQLLTGRKKLASETNISQSKVYRLLKCFENEHLIEQQNMTTNSLITILNYDEHQDCEHQTEHRVNTERTPSEHRVNTNKNDKNDKNEKKHIKKEKTSFENVWERYPLKDGKKQALKHFTASVKSETDIININKALDNYLSHLDSETWKKPKNGSTWFNNWQDWIDFKQEKSQDQIEKDFLERIENANAK